MTIATSKFTLTEFLAMPETKPASEYINSDARTGRNTLGTNRSSNIRVVDNVKCLWRYRSRV